MRIFRKSKIHPNFIKAPADLKLSKKVRALKQFADRFNRLEAAIKHSKEANNRFEETINYSEEANNRFEEPINYSEEAINRCEEAINRVEEAIKYNLLYFSTLQPFRENQHIQKKQYEIDCNQVFRHKKQLLSLYQVIYNFKLTQLVIVKYEIHNTTKKTTRQKFFRIFATPPQEGNFISSQRKNPFKKLKGFF